MAATYLGVKLLKMDIYHRITLGKNSELQDKSIIGRPDIGFWSAFLLTRLMNI
jgi:hypothetical protein